MTLCSLQDIHLHTYVHHTLIQGFRCTRGCSELVTIEVQWTMRIPDFCVYFSSSQIFPFSDCYTEVDSCFCCHQHLGGEATNPSVEPVICLG